MKLYLTATLFLAGALLTASCSDSDNQVEGYFGLEGNPTGVTVPTDRHHQEQAHTAHRTL